MSQAEPDDTVVFTGEDETEVHALLDELTREGIEARRGEERRVLVAAEDADEARAVLARWVGEAEEEVEERASTGRGSGWVAVATLVAFAASVALNVWLYGQRGAPAPIGDVRSRWSDGATQAIYTYRDGHIWPHRARSYARDGRLTTTSYDRDGDGNSERVVIHGSPDYTYLDYDDDGVQEELTYPQRGGQSTYRDHDDVLGFEYGEWTDGETIVRYRDQDGDGSFERAERVGPAGRRASLVDEDGDGFADAVECGQRRTFDVERCDWRDAAPP